MAQEEWKKVWIFKRVRRDIAEHPDPAITCRKTPHDFDRAVEHHIIDHAQQIGASGGVEEFRRQNQRSIRIAQARISFIKGDPALWQ